MTNKNHELLSRYKIQMEEMFRLECISSLLDWDHQVNLPVKGTQARGEQLELMSRLTHQRQTSKELQAIIKDLYEGLDELEHDDRINIQESKLQMDKSLKLPEDFIARRSRARSAAYAAWVEARKADDFSIAKEQLRANISIAREEAELLGYEETPYDALLDNFEPGSRLSIIKQPLFMLAEGIKQKLPAILAATEPAHPFGSTFDISKQRSLNEQISHDLGYDFRAGRMDIAPHPFMTTLGAHDKRITTRYDESDYLSSLLTAMHEVGHATYEQGLPPEHAGTPRGSAISLSIHESQSRLWENIVGRSRPFAEYLYNLLPDYFPEEAAKASPEHIWQRLNSVKPSLIRVEADEVTYSLHIVIRTILEEEIINHGLGVDDLPARWNELYKEYLDLEVPDDAHGILQDVHWYGVGLGYFPTYALGNLYSAIMMEKIRDSVQDLDQKIVRGEFQEILLWLRANVHQIGMSLRGPELAREISGNDLSEIPFLNYIAGKFDL